MTRLNAPIPGQMLVWGLLLAGALLLGVRSARTVEQVLKSGAAVPQASVQAADSLEKQARQSQVRADRLAQAIPAARDPFRPAPRHQAVPIPRAAAAPVPPVEPVLRGLLYDNVEPAVQVSLGKSVSGWLSRGEKFSGWTVVEIKPASVLVANGLRSIELRLN